MNDESPKYLNPFTDYGFKNLFGKEYSKDILIDFLNELYKDLPNMREIKDIRYSDKEMSRLTPDGKTIIYDIHCEIDKEHHFIVEMQVNSQSTFLSRAIYYLCRAISEQGEIGDWNYNFQPVYGVYFTNFKMSNLPAKVKTHCMLSDLEDGKPLSDKICLSFIQLDYFNKEKEDCRNGFDQWIYVLKNLSTMTEMPFTEEKKIFAKVKTVSDLHRLNHEQRIEYDAALKRYRDYKVTILTAIEDGKKKGMEEGRAEGRAEGAQNKLREIVANLRNNGLNDSEIAKLINEPLESISNL